MNEFSKMQQRVADLESGKRSLKASSKELAVTPYIPNPNEKSTLGSMNIPRDRQLTMEEITEFYHDQKRKNYDLETKLRNLPIKSFNHGSSGMLKNPLKKDMPPAPEEKNNLLYDKVLGLEKEIRSVLGTVKDSVGN
jgi:hypothetical protein